MKDLKVYIEVDMEGISNVSELKQVIPGYREWEKAREYMTMDVNAAVRGVKKAAQEQGKKAIIDVADSHWKMDNILPDELDQDVNKLFRGIENRRYPQLPGMDSSYDAVICLGNHDHWKGDGVLSHTWLFWEWTVNGRVVSETDLNALTAGEHRVPVILLEGDNIITSKTVKRFRELGSDIKSVVTKEAWGWQSAACYPFQKILKDIEVSSYEAVMELEKGNKYHPIVSEGSTTITVDFDEPNKVQKVLDEVKGSEFVGGNTIKFSRNNFEEAVAVGGSILDMFYEPTLTPLEIKV